MIENKFLVFLFDVALILFPGVHSLWGWDIEFSYLHDYDENDIGHSYRFFHFSSPCLWLPHVQVTLGDDLSC